MPCYQEALMSVDLKAANKDLLHSALQSLGLTYKETSRGLVITTPNGDIVIKNDKADLSANNQDWLNKIKQAYSIKTVEYLARKYKFTVTRQGDNKLTLRRYS